MDTMGPRMGRIIEKTLECRNWVGVFHCKANFAIRPKIKEKLETYAAVAAKCSCLFLTTVLAAHSFDGTYIQDSCCLKL